MQHHAAGEHAMSPEFIQFSDAYRTYDVENIISTSLTIRYPEAPKGKNLKVYAQDLAGYTPVDITGEVTIEGSCMKVPGKTISRVGSMNATEGDLSGPGLVLKVM